MHNQIKAMTWLRRQIILSNKSILVQVLLPFGFAYLYKAIYEVQGNLNPSTKVGLLVTCLAMALSLAVGNPISTIVAEEKEKNTLRTLLLSGVNSKIYIISTLVYPLIISILSLYLIPYILQLKIKNDFDTYSLVVLMTTFTLMFIYLFIGLVSKTQVASQVISLPVTMFSLFIPMLSGLSDDFDKLVTYSYMGLFTKALKNLDAFSWEKEIPSLVSLLVWLIIFAVLTLWQTKRLRKVS